ncbi:hypothetical protein [Streptomyces antarcticus]|uniref:hypothetical protein n=1 Tax=Streptomyces antarcticus TaxID=2996458 RepID=UPI00226E492C|nr:MULTISPECIES: hypothetical protein [unclassified Streptomyces]MCY0947057.1 hypothetical protein [Streptomyces sp. H34-AA3]MCZ4084764.1 hypothetical protein [Streptomyces sp. H34-S5]
MSAPTKAAALVSRGDVIGYEGQWRRVRALRMDTGSMGELSVVVAWEEGGFDRFPAEDDLLLRTPCLFA